MAHFEDLTQAHEAVQRARAQLAALGPLLAECDAHDKVAAEIAALTAQRTALRYYFADLKAGLVDRLLADLSTERTGLHAQLTDLATRLKDLRSRERSLDIELVGHGGNRLAEIDRLLEENEAATRDRMDRAERFGKLLAEAGLDPVETAEHFAARRRGIAAARDRAKADLADAQNRLTDAGYAAKALEDKAAGVNAELVSLREHPNNIPRRQLDLFLREDMVEASPAIWFIQVDGLIVDAREFPSAVQAQAFELGVIPYIPALGRDGTTVWLSENGHA